MQSWRVPSQHATEDRLLWDIVHEHLDEGAYLFTQWERALCSPLYTLPRLQRTVEARLLAHVDGLVVGGAPVRDGLLLPRLAGGGEGETFVAALALLSEGPLQAQQQVVEALSAAQGATRRELIRALQLQLPETLVTALQALLTHTRGTARAGALEVLAAHRRLELQEVRAGLEDASEEVQRVALRALRSMGLAGLAQGQVGRYLLSNFPAQTESGQQLQQAALEVVLVMGQGELLELAYAVGQGRYRFSLPWGEGFRLLGARLGQRAVPMLEAVLAQKDQTALHGPALQGLGLTGALEAAEVCLWAMQEPGLTRVAGEAFALITGADLNSERLRMTPAPTQHTEGGLEEKFLGDPEEDLPLGQVEAVTRAWREVRMRWEPRKRYLCGHAESPTILAEVLRGGSMYRRRLVLRRVERWTQGTWEIRGDALSRVQQAHMEGVLRYVQQTPPSLL